MKYLLINLPETITIFAFFLVLFYSVVKPLNIINVVISFIGFYLVDCLCDTFIINDMFKALAMILIMSSIWSLCFECDIKSFHLKSIITATVCIIGIGILQIWIPLYLLITGQNANILNDTMTQFYFSIPNRLIEYLIIICIWKYGLTPLLKAASNITTYAAKASIRPASLFWIYQPKIPKSLGRNN